MAGFPLRTLRSRRSTLIFAEGASKWSRARHLGAGRIVVLVQTDGPEQLARVVEAPYLHHAQVASQRHFLAQVRRDQLQPVSVAFARSAVGRPPGRSGTVARDQGDQLLVAERNGNETAEVLGSGGAAIEDIAAQVEQREPPLVGDEHGGGSPIGVRASMRSEAGRFTDTWSE